MRTNRWILCTGLLICCSLGCATEEIVPDVSVRPTPDAAGTRDVQVIDDTLTGTDPCRGVPTEGRCRAIDQVERCAVPTGMDPPTVELVRCARDEQCRTTNFGAQCVLTAACREGESSCIGASLRTCAAGQWQSTTCAQGCITGAGGAYCNTASPTQTVRGTFVYEARIPNSTRTNWSAPMSYPGRGFSVVSFRGTTIIDSTSTADDGTFSVRVPSPPRTDDLIAVVALDVTPSGEARLAVGDPNLATGTSNIGTLGSTPALWHWRWTYGNIPTNGQFLVREADGSGAASVFDDIRDARRRAIEVYTDTDPGSTIVWVGFGTEWSCGSCFNRLPVNAFALTFDSQIWISADSDMGYYSVSVNAHETGHWVMYRFGRSPNEGGTHIVSFPSPPGLAWSEGFATWYSSNYRQSTVYTDKQNNGMFWFDIFRRQYSNGQTWQLPSPTLPLIQLIDENEVAGMLWTLGLTPAGDLPLLRALHDERLTVPTFERGYTTRRFHIDPSTYRYVFDSDTGISAPFIADFLDSVNCLGSISRTQIDTATEPTVAYPYVSSQPFCR